MGLQQVPAATADTCSHICEQSELRKTSHIYWLRSSKTNIVQNYMHTKVNTSFHLIKNILLRHERGNVFALKNTFAERCMDLGVFVQNTCDSEISVQNTCDSEISVQNPFMHSSHHILWISTLRDFPFAILQHIKVHFKWASNRY